MINCSLPFNTKNLTLNFGPQHPAAHGVLRLNLELHNERIIKCDPHIGLLHRGTELLILTKPNLLSLPYFDRLDYVSMLTQEHAYSLSIESIQKNFTQPIIVQQNRVIMDEISRILNHLLAIACHALDVGSMSIIFWSFEERENFMEIYENITGARMHTAFTRPIFFNKNISNNNIIKLIYILQTLPITITEITSILNINKVWKIRLKNIGILTTKDEILYNISGVLARSVNIKKDLRQLKSTTYSFYKFINFLSYTTKNGDSLDRFNLRLYEILESINIINTISFIILKKKTNINKFTMEDVITHFKIWSGFNKINSGNCSTYIESSKGLFGVNTILNTSTIPVTCKIRSPSYNHLYLLKNLSKGLQLADLITLIGTIDIVFGEIDR